MVSFRVCSSCIHVVQVLGGSPGLRVFGVLYLVGCCFWLVAFVFVGGGFFCLVIFGLFEVLVNFSIVFFKGVLYFCGRVFGVAGREYSSGCGVVVSSFVFGLLLLCFFFARGFVIGWYEVLCFWRLCVWLFYVGFVWVCSRCLVVSILVIWMCWWVFCLLFCGWGLCTSFFEFVLVVNQVICLLKKGWI